MTRIFFKIILAVIEIARDDPLLNTAVLEQNFVEHEYCLDIEQNRSGWTEVSG